VLIVGVTLSASGASVVAVRYHDYLDTAAELASSGTRTVQLPGGDDVIFVGERGQADRRPFAPGQVVVVEVRDGADVPVRWDQSSDDLSPRGMPSHGLLSFIAPSAGSYRITIDGPKGLFVTVVRNEGAEARLLAGWIALLAVGLVLVALAVGGLLQGRRRRTRTSRSGEERPHTIKEWIARTPY
jgi:hypothetical protein